MTLNERYQGIIKMKAADQFGTRKPYQFDLSEAQILAQLTKDEIALIASLRTQLADKSVEVLESAMAVAKEKMAKIEAGEFIGNADFLLFFRRAIALKQELGARNGN